MSGHRVFAAAFADIHRLYVTKVERKGRSRDELDQVIGWLTGYDRAGLERAIADGVDLATFFAAAPAVHPQAHLVTGMICGHRIEDIEDPLMQQIRRMDKLVDELARGRKLAAVLRGTAPADA